MECFPTETILAQTNLFWQYPVITEETFYQQNKHDPCYMGFPWATCIDKRVDMNSIFRAMLPNVNQYTAYYTCCQHIHFRLLAKLFQVLRITKVYIPHKTKGEDTLLEMKLEACPLYAVNLEDPTRNSEFRDVDFASIEKPLLYSFVGGVQSQYLTQIRNELFAMKHPENTVVVNTGTWHFNDTVYSSKQNAQRELPNDASHVDKTTKYNQILLQSKFSLCPSGSGPNSIRFWESLGCGAIPVLLADTLELPKGVDWDSAIVVVPEKDVRTLPKMLQEMSSDEVDERKRKCLAIYARLKNAYKPCN